MKIDPEQHIVPSICYRQVFQPYGQTIFSPYATYTYVLQNFRMERAPFEHESPLITGDFTGDGTLDTAKLAWNKNAPDSEYVTDITLIIRNGSTGAELTFPLPENSGYSPTLFAGDFTGDHIPDLFISIQSGGSGAMTYNFLYTYKDAVLHTLFDSDHYNEEQKYTVEYLDYYRIRVTSLNHRQSYLIDITARGSDYLSAIYNENGKLKHPLKGEVLPVSGVFPVDFDQNGVYELLTFQGIMGQYDADRFGYVQNALTYKEGAWNFMNQWVAIYGTDLVVPRM
ncbi:VCBS repeat-containing protein [Paenibacillus sp. Marseille-Q4541]|uniref:VCBS repeat-containing protein n=1 Tax=Paenibacillus sp. Marseille-Q4541 TaxID=2831522 RepID=UPI001BA7B90F|nr:VCBS repeat-containing protein [Paenibacillus sp. Marseille-Q4541]